ncbi:MAG: N-acetyl-gamma-glutamyl-phosphate reductase [Oscillospiraceae bacterium]|jgi:N-acetyl-gamma-glutamyl-phosphate reductase|nr:N-acetyl-gamma-glutamyl-phosphate reductase [Oscillospiraceae bacterium]
MISVFIDGSEGTTGLNLRQRLTFSDVEILDIDENLRKEPDERKRLINAADCVFLCLPDEAARQAAALCENPRTVIIDASTAHRVAPGWAYGFPELSPAHALAVAASRRIAVPGCHASGFCALIYPLRAKGLLPREAELSCVSLTGYSGGGKAMIEQYEGGGRANACASYYALTLRHKHLPEMQAVCSLAVPPVFTPAVLPVRQGMLVTVPLHADADTLYAALAGHYAACEGITVYRDTGGAMPDIQAANGTDRLDIFVFGHGAQTLLAARFDNLGKGACGAAIQCFGMRYGL